MAATSRRPSAQQPPTVRIAIMIGMSGGSKHTIPNWWRDQAVREYFALFGEQQLWVDPALQLAASSSDSTRVPAPAQAPVLSKSAPKPKPKPAQSPPPVKTMVGQLKHAESSEALDRVRDHMGDCQKCRLCETRINIVFGEGDPHAKVMFIGEGPGAQEDASGRPFVGRAGRLLTDIIEKGMQLAREEVFIANIVKCRPPGNRDPEADEVEACRPFLLEQIAAIKPKVVILLGKPACRAMLGHEGPMGMIRGKWHDVNGVAAMPTWHPSYLLRSPGHKKETWADIQEVMKKAGLA